MLVANIKIWKSQLNIREGSDYTYTCRYGHAPRMPRLVEQLFHKLPDPETVLIGVARGPVPDP